MIWDVQTGHRRLCPAAEPNKVGFLKSCWTPSRHHGFFNTKNWSNWWLGMNSGPWLSETSVNGKIDHVLVLTCFNMGRSCEKHRKNLWKNLWRTQPLQAPESASTASTAASSADSPVPSLGAPGYLLSVAPGPNPTQRPLRHTAPGEFFAQFRRPVRSAAKDNQKRSEWGTEWPSAPRGQGKTRLVTGVFSGI